MWQDTYMFMCIYFFTAARTFHEVEGDHVSYSHICTGPESIVYRCAYLDCLTTCFAGGYMYL